MRHPDILTPDKTALVVVDFQEKLLAVFDPEAVAAVTANASKFIKLAKIYGLPILYTEQYPKGLGRTVESVKADLAEYEPIEKTEFSCFGNEQFKDALAAQHVDTVVITGVEAHICVAQTALDALHAGYKTHVLVDAVESRKPEEYAHGIQKIGNAGAVLSSTEAAMYEVMFRAGTPEFKQALPLIK